MNNVIIPFASGSRRPMSKMHTLNSKPASVFLASLFLAWTIAFSLTFVYLGSIGWPGLHWDAALFGTVVINVASGKGWVFGGYTLQILALPSLDYDFHGILQVFFYGAFLKCNSWAKFMLAQGWINAITFATYSLFYAFVLIRQYGSNLLCFLLSFLLASLSGVICIGLQGRPEQLAPLILCISLVSSILVLSGTKRLLANSICLAFLIVLSPLIGIFFSTLILFYLFAVENKGVKCWLRRSVLFLGVAILLSMVLIWLLTPISPLAWTMNIVQDGVVAPSFEGLLIGFRHYRWGYTLIAPAWNLISLLLIAAGSVWLWCAKHSVFSLLLLAIALIFYNEKMCDYGYTSFIPYGIGLCLLGAKQFLKGLQPGWLPKFFVFASMAVSFAYVFVLFSYLFVVRVTPSEQYALAEARNRFERSQAGMALVKGTAAVGFPALMMPSMVVLGDASSAFATFNPGPYPSTDHTLDKYESKINRSVEYLIYPQTETARNSTPPPFLYVGRAKFDLEESFWVSPGVADRMLIPTRLANRYNFAIYKRLLPASWFH
jgi:hypothetical protein